MDEEMNERRGRARDSNDGQVEAPRRGLPAWLDGQTVAIIGAFFTGGVGIAALVLATTSALRTDFKTDIAVLREEVKSDIGELREEVKSDTGELREDIKGIDARLRLVEIDVAAIRATLAAFGGVAPTQRGTEDGASKDASPTGDTRD